MGGFPVNPGGISVAQGVYMASEIGVEDGIMVVSACKDLHVYEHTCVGGSLCGLRKM